LSRGVNILSKSADIFGRKNDRRNDMKAKFLILGISIGYAVLLALYYSA
jgi:hypothetical protein